VVNALFASPAWPRSAMFLTYDEHGGYYDHVPPPAACVPGDAAPLLQPGDTVADFDRYGFRVPFVLVSPYARPHYVSHRPQDHTSILRFIETRFDLPALTNRDANAEPMLDLFDFSHPALLNPPPLSPVTVDPAQLQQCRDDFPTMHY
jgi:phospholipase C